VRKQRRATLTVLFAAILVLASAAWGGHEVPIYPSYYPHEITIEVVPPENAAALLQTAKIHAYLGSEPLYAGEPAKPIREIEALGDLVVVHVEPASNVAAGDPCVAMKAAVEALADKSDFVFHPYPVTPFHGDYLYHVDRVDAAKAASRDSAAVVMPGWSSAVEMVDAAAVLNGSITAVNGWLGAPWIKTGWFQAWQVLGSALTGDARQQAEVLVERLKAGDYRDAVERINLERGLVAALAGNCNRQIAGYTVRHQYFTAEFTNGIENIGFDSIVGLNSPIFVRTVKLKDFPWNGELTLGIDGAPRAAWNPIAGFDDNFGRALWHALGDPALLPDPYGAGWMLNRASDVRAGP
jgi:hypothetical protein